MSDKIFVIKGCTIVDGIIVDVVLRIDAAALIDKLGSKAVLNASSKAIAFHGLVCATAEKSQAGAVRKARAVKRAERRARVLAQREARAAEDAEANRINNDTSGPA